MNDTPTPMTLEEHEETLKMDVNINIKIYDGHLHITSKDVPGLMLTDTEDLIEAIQTLSKLNGTSLFSSHVLVPLEPTEKMHQAGLEHFDKISGEELEPLTDLYKAMLKAFQS